VRPQRAGRVFEQLGVELLPAEPGAFVLAQGEAKAEPNRVLDNRRQKAVAAIREQDHGERLSYPLLALTPFP